MLVEVNNNVGNEAERGDIIKIENDYFMVTSDNALSLLSLKTGQLCNDFSSECKNLDNRNYKIISKRDEGTLEIK